MLVPDHCVRKGQHLTFDDSWTWSYLRGVWEKFSGNVTISIINLSHMCAYSAILQLKIINNKSIYRGDRTQQDTTWHLSKGGTEWDNRPHIFQTGWCCATVSNQSILPRMLGISDIYRWMVGPLYTLKYIGHRVIRATSKPNFGWAPARGGVLGWVLDRDAQHRPLTRNATKGEKGGSKLYILTNFDKK